MTEDEARLWIDSHFDVPRETRAKIERYIELLLYESGRQNLIAQSTQLVIWSRHIVDSAQLLLLAPDVKEQSLWVDLGSGAGLPGLVIAMLSGWNVRLVESRAKRAHFLENMVSELALTNVEVVGGRVETLKLDRPATVISARAFAPLPKLFDSAHHLGNSKTFWLLPKGKSWQSDLEAAKLNWRGVFHVEHSCTDTESAIIIAKSVRRKG